MSERPFDQEDQPGFGHFPDDGSEGPAFGGDVVPLRAPDAAPSEDRPLAIGAGGDAVGERARLKRERMTLMRIFQDLRILGYEGSCDAVRRYALRWIAGR